MGRALGRASGSYACTAIIDIALKIKVAEAGAGAIAADDDAVPR